MLIIQENLYYTGKIKKESNKVIFDPDNEDETSFDLGDYEFKNTIENIIKKYDICTKFGQVLPEVFF